MLLLEHDVPHQDFSQAVLSFLPKMPWNITEEVTGGPVMAAILCQDIYQWLSAGGYVVVAITINNLLTLLKACWYNCIMVWL